MQHIHHERARHASQVETVMNVKLGVFGGEHCANKRARDVVHRHDGAAFDVQLSERLAVARHDPRRLHRP